jgi:hypothetical protein
VFSRLDAAYLQQVKGNLAAAVPGVFLPAATPPAGLPDLQLGYPLWLLVLAAAATAYRSEAAHKALVGTFLAVAVFVLPVPWLTERLWSLLPRPFMLSSTWPMLRLWPLLASLACLAGMLALRRLPRTRLSACLSLAVLAALGAWGLREAGKFRAWGETKAAATGGRVAASLSEESAPLYAYAVPPGTRWHPEGGHDFARWCDPALEQRLLRLDESPLTSALESVDLRPAGQDGDVRLENGELPRRFSRSGTDGLLRVRVRPGLRHLLAVRYRTDNFRGHLQCLGTRTYRDCWLAPDSRGEATAFVPLWTSGREETEVEVRLCSDFSGREGKASVEITSIAWGTYRPDDLPIGLPSLVPYRARVTATEPCLLQAARLYTPGYEARVNGRRVPVSASQGAVTVPVPAGPSVVELRYRGTPAMRAAFWASAAGWLGLVVVALGAGRRRGRTAAPVSAPPGEPKLAA